MTGDTGLRVCAGMFKTTIMLMSVRDSSVRVFVCFINCSVLLVSRECFVSNGNSYRMSASKANGHEQGAGTEDVITVLVVVHRQAADWFL